jgi:hypothetical protein
MSDATPLEGIFCFVTAISTNPVTLSNPGPVDGVTLAIGNYVLLAAQSVVAQNGIYIVGSNGLERCRQPVSFQTLVWPTGAGLDNVGHMWGLVPPNTTDWQIVL